MVIPNLQISQGKGEEKIYSKFNVSNDWPPAKYLVYIERYQTIYDYRKPSEQFEVRTMDILPYTIAMNFKYPFNPNFNKRIN